MCQVCSTLSDSANMHKYFKMIIIIILALVDTMNSKKSVILFTLQAHCFKHSKHWTFFSFCWKKLELLQLIPKMVHQKILAEMKSLSPTPVRAQSEEEKIEFEEKLKKCSPLLPVAFAFSFVNSYIIFSYSILWTRVGKVSPSRLSAPGWFSECFVLFCFVSHVLFPFLSVTIPLFFPDTWTQKNLSWGNPPRTKVRFHFFLIYQLSFQLFPFIR